MSKVYLSIGSNIGDRYENCNEAVRLVGGTQGIEIQRVSSLYLTKPVGGPPNQREYMNGVVEMETVLLPEACLDVLKDIEKQMGRTPAEKDHPRIIDIDILFYDSLVMEEPDLIIPHPGAHTREFVLRGLNELAPDMVHPYMGATMAELYASVKGESEVGSRRSNVGRTT
ncbi:MAG: 2-amino-4-hydroxy-6-hydroxymethyldihydropteridine diphosphokinase [Candidatus Omnitrophica bacterium]|nr:2-amino-4-hydroxy-6-hydroxymethyldihydropteridine diphosphokinase [Candidatus Omnitrophota bacterium]